MSGVSGIGPLLLIRLLRDGGFIDGRVIATKQIAPGGTLLDPTNRVIKEMQKLIQTDLPETQILLSDDGQITVKTE